ncbi:site-specific integrase [Mesorhizobium sp. M4A.F.Ca.ET.020.02.1.1]|uniref:site-specific integrase n=1 Tax=Mesorhizobium sp. M4A.F.Ca.ET.020.02.1.1 TaxID=2496652 RepID=UPI000FD2AEAD|nr:site-specific integrase [Mesorhizobium sp. M4A.F.Ca.ET.020.02.1.1]RVD34165.1 site-specific integrase [Mesorhizobium sp. M4A.F.Ca.ET.020.02.1.1]
MGTIVERPRGDGTTAFMAKIILKQKGKVAHRESKTFDRRPAASAWIDKREKELAQPGALDRVKVDDPPLKDVIATYIADSLKEAGRTKGQVLASIQEDEIADLHCSAIGSPQLVDFARRLARTREASTVGNYLSHLSEVFTVARPAWGYPLDTRAIDDARIVAKRLGLIGRSKARERRPTIEELETLMTFFAGRKATAAPMTKLTAFAIFSTRRQEEITRITWADLDEEHSRVLVRDMKNPTEKTGNDVWCDLPPEALAIIQTMPRGKGAIFPYKPDTIGLAFREACALKEIEDLRFHDLRHEGISRLFELGWNIPHVAAVSGHRSWQNLKRYTHIRQRADKYAGWKWHTIVAPGKEKAEE